jgi:hypothetical protein
VENGGELLQSLKVKFAGVSYELEVTILTVADPKAVLAELFQLQKGSVKLSCKGKMVEPESLKPGETVMLFGSRTADVHGQLSANLDQSTSVWLNWTPQLWQLLMDMLGIIWLFFASFFESRDARERRRDGYIPDHVVDPNRPFDPEGRRAPATASAQRAAPQDGFAAPGDTVRPDIERTE